MALRRKAPTANIPTPRKSEFMTPGERQAQEAPMSSEDEATVRRALAGDAQAFEELYKKYRPAVFKVAFNVAGNVEDALDVTQETFLKAHRCLESFEGRASVLTWLCQIAIHRAIDL